MPLILRCSMLSLEPTVAYISSTASGRLVTTNFICLCFSLSPQISLKSWIDLTFRSSKPSHKNSMSNDGSAKQVIISSLPILSLTSGSNSPIRSPTEDKYGLRNNMGKMKIYLVVFISFPPSVQSLTVNLMIVLFPPPGSESRRRIPESGTKLIIFL
ncbi:unnamed protein product [Meganyctiphanes norvegica]|uniref:Uncharacterized protein n=1 Tax=Meganyctiphanes norvegica TaxID=48144 RepID=A0AAV2R2T4_MEGNR